MLKSLLVGALFAGLGAGLLAVVDIPVFMVQRPAPPPGPLAASLAEAVAWVAKTVATCT